MCPPDKRGESHASIPSILLFLLSLIHPFPQPTSNLLTDIKALPTQPLYKLNMYIPLIVTPDIVPPSPKLGIVLDYQILDTTFF